VENSRGATEANGEAASKDYTELCSRDGARTTVMRGTPYRNKVALTVLSDTVQELV
jgi:hypothetical protein